MLKTIETVIGHWVTLIKAHEKLLVVAIVAFTFIHFGDKAYDAYGRHLIQQQTETNAQIATVEKNNADLAAKLDALKTSVDAQAKIDQAKIAVAQAKLKTQQQVDAALPLPDLSQHWESILALPQGSITPQLNGTVAVTTDAAHSTVNELEKIQPLTEEVAAAQDELKGCNDVRAQQDTQITGLKTDVDLEKKGRTEDAKLAKHNIRHAYLKGFKHGLIVGVVGTTAAFVAFFH